MKRDGFWRGREDNLFAIALGAAIGIGAAVPVSLLVRVAISLVIFIFCIWLLGRYPAIILQTVAGITRFNPTVIQISGFLITGGLVALILLSSGPAHSHSPVGWLAYIAAAVMMSLVIGISAAAWRYKGGFPTGAFMSLLLVLILTDAVFGAGSAAVIRVIFPSSWLASTVYGGIVSGAIGSLLLRLQLFAVQIGGERVSLGPAFIYQSAVASLDRGVDRSLAYQRYREINRVLEEPEIHGASSATMIEAARKMVEDHLVGKDRSEALVYLERIAHNSQKLTDDAQKYMIVFALTSYFPIDQVADFIVRWG